MKKIILTSSLAAALFLFSGCDSEDKKESTDTTPTVEDVVPEKETVLTPSLDPKNEQYYKYLWHIDSENSKNNSISQKVSNYYEGQYEIGQIDENADINILDAWKITRGKDVIVAVIDDGADIEHEDLKANIHLAYNADDDTSDVSNHSSDIKHASHGNTCAGFIVAPVNEIGTIGTAPEAKIIIIKQNDDSDSHTLRAFEYAKNHGAKVISCSWGTGYISEALQEELKSMYDSGITVLFASGNDNKDLDKIGVEDESESPWVIGVGASGENNKQTPYSNYGKYIDILAPGGDASNSTGILGIDDTGTQGSVENYGLVSNNYAFTNGTSFSTPVAAGVVALMYSVNPNITPAQVRDILIDTSVDIGSTIKKIDATAAVKKAQELNN